MSATLDRDMFHAPEDRGLEQRRRALVRANRVRVQRAECKIAVRAGTVSVADLLRDPPEWLLSMRIGELLLAVPKLGRVKVQRLLALQGVSPTKRIGGAGGLTERQRLSILRQVR